MLVVNWMSPKLIGVGPDDSLAQAMRLMKDNGVGHLPVLKEQKLVGIISDRDVKTASAFEAAGMEVHELSYLLSRVKVKDIMTPDPVTVHLHDSIDDAALLMLENKISALPVLDDQKKVVAMLAQTDLFRALVLLSGVVHGGVQFAIDLPDEPGSIKQVADVIRKYGGKMVCIYTSYDRVAQGRRQVYIRVKNIDAKEREQIRQELAGLGELIYVLDSDRKEVELLAPRSFAAPGADDASFRRDDK